MSLRRPGLVAGGLALGFCAAIAFSVLRSNRSELSQEALEKAEALYADLSANAFDLHKVDRANMFLSDQDFAEDPQFHRPEGKRMVQTPAFMIAYQGHEVYRGQVAFYSPIFARMNYDRVVADAWSVHPSGYWLVCDWNGVVSQVDVKDVKHLKISNPGEPEKFLPVFPCMVEYDRATKLY